MTSLINNTQFIKNEALKLGFSYIGISKAQKLDQEAIRLQDWLHGGNQSSMDYMESHFDKRIDPTELVRDTKSVISLSYNYYTDKDFDKDNLKISRYAYGRDYHYTLKKKLKKLFQLIKNEIPETAGRYFVDSAPVLERAWARKSGLGWIGKSTMLINPKAGTFFFLSEMLLNLELEYDQELIDDHCGKCRRCIDACPTGAISHQGYKLDAGKCISYITIENKAEIPSSFKGKMENYIFGCDICQLVCPWNRFATEHEEEDFLPKESLFNMKKNDWENIGQQRFYKLFEETPVKRAKFSGLRRNIDFIAQKKQ